MAMQTGIGLSRIILIAGAGYTGTILVKNGKLSDILGELKDILLRVEKSGKESEGDTDQSDALAKQIRMLAEELRRRSSQQITVLNGNSGNVTSMIMPAAALGALGYGYMRWKGIAFSDLMYVTKRSMANAVTSLTENLGKVTEALNAAKRHLTQRIENLDGKMDDQRELSKQIKEDVSGIQTNLNGLGSELESLQQLVSGLDWRLDGLEYKQDVANVGINYLIHRANGERAEMPKILQEQVKLFGISRASLPQGERMLLLQGLGLKDISGVTSESIKRSASDAVAQDRGDRSEQRPRALPRANSNKC